MAGNKDDVITKRQLPMNGFNVGDKLEICRSDSGGLTFRKYEPLAQTKPMLLFKMLWSHICDRLYIESLALITETECLASAGNDGINLQDFIADIWANIKQNGSDYFTLSIGADDERTISVMPLYERGHGHASAIGALVCCLNNNVTAGSASMTDLRLSTLLFSDIID